MLNPTQEHPATFKALDEDFKDMNVLCSFKIKIESQIGIMGVSKTNDYIQIKIKMPNSNQEPPVSSKATNEDSKVMHVLCTFKIKIES